MSSSKFNRRNFLKLTAAAASGAVLGACAPAVTPTAAPTNPPAPTATTPPAEPVNIEFWNGDSIDYQLGYTLITDAFNAAHPDIKVEVKNAPGGAFDEKLLTMIAGGEGPDCWLQIPTASQARLGHYAHLDPFLERDGIDLASTWFELAWKSHQWEGKMYSVPRDVGWSAMAYNKDLFDDMGVEYPPVTDFTYDQFLDLALKTTDVDKGYWGTNFVGAGTLLWYGSIGFNLGFVANSPDGRTVKGLLDSDASIEAIQKILDLEVKHKVGPGAAAMDALGNGFGSGKVALGDCSTWGLKDQKEFPFAWEQVRQPMVPGQQEYSWGGSPAFFMWTKAQNQDQIWELLKFASTDGSKLAHEAGQWQSPMPSVWLETGADKDPLLNFYLEYAKLPTDTPPYEREQFWECVGTPYFDIWTRYIENGETDLKKIVTEAADTAQTALDDAFANQ
ncbi:MAG: extracellular solute-binding protein [Anaerolineales bacterium]|nr:extracellular solute-binding protein [Anaerolineales bacterium]